MKLIPALKLAMKVANGKSNLPCLNHISLSPGLVEATDLSVWIRIKTEYSGPAVLVPVSALKDSLRKAKTLNVSPSPTPGKFTLNNGAVSTEIAGFDPADYPQAPVDLGQLLPVTTIRQARLKRAHARLGAHVGDELRITLQYYAMEIHPEGKTESASVPGMARLIATNGQTLSTANLRSTGSSQGEPSTHFVHPRAVELLLQSEGSSVAFSELAEGEGNFRLLVANEDCSVLASTNVGLNSFPRWRQLGGPKGPLAEIVVLASALAPVLEAVPRGPVPVHLAADGATCLVGWADAASQDKVTPRANLEERYREKGSHPRLDFALMGTYLKALVARAPGALTFGLGSNCTRPDSVLGYDESLVVCADSGQEAGEVTWIMPVRTKGKGLPGPAASDAVTAYLQDRGQALEVFRPVEAAYAP